MPSWIVSDPDERLGMDRARPLLLFSRPWYPACMKVTVGDVTWTLTETALVSLRSIFGSCDEAFARELLNNARPLDGVHGRAEKWRTGRRFRRLGLMVAPSSDGRRCAVVKVVR